MNIPPAVKANPMNWKDYITAFGLLLTLATVAVQGGRILERLDVHAEAQKRLVLEFSQAKIDIARLEGRDELHSFQLDAMKRDLAAVSAKEAKK